MANDAIVEHLYYFMSLLFFYNFRVMQQHCLLFVCLFSRLVLSTCMMCDVLLFCFSSEELKRFLGSEVTMAGVCR